MKTTNKIQKTVLTAVAAAGLVIISFTIDGQTSIKTLFEDIEINHIAMVMSKSNDSFGAITAHVGNINVANTYTAYLAEETEEPLELEDWMTDEANFATMALFEAETESPMEIEDWMLNEHYFDANSFNLEIETENEMQLEDWMTNENIFDVNQNESQVNYSKAGNKIISTRTFIFSEEKDESKLKIEDWMVDPTVWK